MGELITNVTNTYGSYSTYKKEEKASDFVYEGEKNKTCLRGFVKLCRKSQKEMKKYLKNRLRSEGYDVIDEDGFLYAPGKIPVLLTAHMDTVHKNTVSDYYEFVMGNGNHKISSPQGIGGDDRCGIFIILMLIAAGYKPYVLFCEDEEIGCVGSGKFVKTKYIDELKKMKYMVQLDRRNDKDCVFYDCDNRDFVKYIEKVTGYEENYGSCSDISWLAPAAGVAAVNLSCGYYNEHHLNEYVIIEEMLNTYKATLKLIEDLDNTEHFKYIEKKYSYGYRGRYAGYYGGWDDEWEDYSSYYYKKESKSESKDEKIVYVEVLYTDENDNELYGYGKGNTIDGAMLDFFKTYSDVCYDMIYDYWEVPTIYPEQVSNM